MLTLGAKLSHLILGMELLIMFLEFATSKGYLHKKNFLAKFLDNLYLVTPFGHHVLAR